MKLPPPPFLTVIFTSEHSDDVDGYAEMATRMETLAKTQEGFLGITSVRAGKQGITVSYWKSREAIRKWQRHPQHLEAQRLGKKKWYSNYQISIAEVIE